jgi:hypothetical protein
MADVTSLIVTTAVTTVDHERISKIRPDKTRNKVLRPRSNDRTRLGATSARLDRVQSLDSTFDLVF